MSLFKKRPRRKDVLRSFTPRGGLGTFAGRVLQRPGITIATGRAATGLARDGAGFAVTLDGSERLTAELVAIATPPQTAARVLAGVLGDAAARVDAIGEATTDSVGVVVRADQVAVIPYATFLIPRGDIFHSVVTRDVVPDPTWRGFVFHFQPGHAEADRLAPDHRAARRRARRPRRRQPAPHHTAVAGARPQGRRRRARRRPSPPSRGSRSPATGSPACRSRFASSARAPSGSASVTRAAQQCRNV
jgi:hypothetical protein